MSFSNTDTGNKPADPYKQQNLQNDVPLNEKVDDLLDFVEKSKYCMMTTKAADTGLLASRCMALAHKDPKTLTLLFHANSESGKTNDLDSSPLINLSFLNSSSGEWASISGTATVETDREEVKRHYASHLKAWLGDLGDGKHDGGPEDPRIVIIKVKAKTAQYSISRRTSAGGLLQVAKGAVTGDTAQVVKLRTLSEEELEEYRKTH